MATGIKIGQRLEGKLGSYFISAQIAKNVWTATHRSSQTGKVVVKTAPAERFENERSILTLFQDRPCIRQMLDEIKGAPFMVLRHLDVNLLSASAEKGIGGIDVKLVAKRILQALHALHEEGYTHTDIKPDNILANYGKGPLRFADIQLADLGDVCRINAAEYLKIGKSGSHIGAAIFRSPEAMLNLRWGPSTDIWSFGATVIHTYPPPPQLISLIWGLHYHIFKPSPQDAGFEDEEFLTHILIRQLATFGPLPASYATLIADEDTARWDALGNAVQFIWENERLKPFVLARDECVTEEDKEFILRIMKLDPRDRPTAGGLLGDKWFAGVP
ncbi:3-phosphoinositide-dependent protein kinase B [Lachnellula arida]|uniref:3-phosphoinositide-dependent protein kinase B n=1 Tax=Lachnellula arida TaxID=1316785 RepID=A0A8T9BCX1_9HELO|nr:3-phosphoinositide-dependent protein kinase B [Lachnellula arida]